MNTGKSAMVLHLVLTETQFTALPFFLISEHNRTEDFSYILEMRRFETVGNMVEVELAAAFTTGENLEFVEELNQKVLFKFSSVVKMLYDMFGLTKT